MEPELRRSSVSAQSLLRRLLFSVLLSPVVLLAFTSAATALTCRTSTCLQPCSANIDLHSVAQELGPCSAATPGHTVQILFSSEETDLLIFLQYNTFSFCRSQDTSSDLLPFHEHSVCVCVLLL